MITIAEESTAWPGVSHPTYAGGLGFGFKWNMGWMHDMLAYLREAPVHRRHHHDSVTFGITYAFAENFVLALSHDEVVHGKLSMLDKMPGDSWQKFATLRAFYAFLWAYPGKKLLFMGQEFAQSREWDFKEGLPWPSLDAPAHLGVQSVVRDCNDRYRAHPALHADDCDASGFRWIVVDDSLHSVFAWLRMAGDHAPPVVVVTNFTEVPHRGYVIGLPRPGRWREILNTDSAVYGGSDVGNLGGVVARASPSHGFACSAEITVPPLATLWFVHDGG
jgi:1,4-alpha-glucan branching enzyme